MAAITSTVRLDEHPSGREAHPAERSDPNDRGFPKRGGIVSAQGRNVRHAMHLLALLHWMDFETAGDSSSE